MCYVTLYKSSRLNTKFPLFVVFTHTITSRGPNIWSTCSINGVEGTASCSDASIFPTQKTSTHSSRPVSHITLAECLPGDSKSYLGLSTLPSITVWNSVSYLSYSCEPLHFNMLSKSVIAFLPRSKPLLISWLQSPSAVIPEPKKIVCHCLHCFSIYLP